MIITPYFLIDLVPYKIELIHATSKISWTKGLVTLVLLSN